LIVDRGAYVPSVPDGWNAVFFRAALLQHLLESGMLNDWRERNEPAALVFQVGAIFPIEQGVQGFQLPR
jgi:hypothetical protein